MSPRLFEGRNLFSLLKIEIKLIPIKSPCISPVISLEIYVLLLMPSRRNFSMGIAWRDHALEHKKNPYLNHWIDPVNTNMLAFPTSQPNLLNLFLFNFITSLSGWGRGGVELRML